MNKFYSQSSIACIPLILCLAQAGHGDDWPCFRHDNARSSATAENLDASHLGLAWTWQSPHPPQPAWAGPAKWDAYANIRNLSSMRDYDLVFHVAVARGRVYFGSSMDDAVRCLDAETGQEQWRYVTDGPVRIAPSVADGRVYFGSDDGYAYCLGATDGERLWRFSPKPNERRVLNNGRMISFWPVRTGVLLDGGTAYFAASMLPWRESYLCAVDEATGEPEGDGRYTHAIGGSSTFEGVLLLAGSRLVAPQGRVAPLLFDRASGTSEGQLDKGGGGCFAIVTPENQIIHGPGNKKGQLVASDATNRTKLAVFPSGKALVVAGNSSYLLSNSTADLKSDTVVAIDRKTRKTRWQYDGKSLLSMVVAGDTVFIGRPDQVIAISASDGKELWRGTVDGTAYGLAVADGALFVSTDEGSIHCFRPGAKAEALVEEPQSDPADNSQTAEFVLASGPLLQFADRHTAVVRWETKTPRPTVLEYYSSGSRESVVEPESKLLHEARLENLKHKRIYTYVIRASTVDTDPTETRPFECDTFFNYESMSASAGESPYADSPAAEKITRAADDILRDTKVDRGVCLVLGSGTGQLAYELARRSRLRVIGIDTDATQVAAAREALGRAGLYGARVTIHHVEAFDRLPFPSSFANLIVSESLLETGQPVSTAQEVHRLLRPSGGVAYLSQSSAGAEKLQKWAGSDHWKVVTKSDQRVCAELVRGALPGAGQWTHQYGGADNAAFAGEKLGGADSSAEFETQWLGRPGPRFHPDRNGRKPGPLSANGRLFAQGLHRIVAADAYNGTILWSAEIPDMIRMNIPRDSSNWCADDEHVFVAIRGRVWRFDANSGKRSRMYQVVPGPNGEWEYDWSYIANRGDLLVGSAVKQGSAFTNFWGDSGQGWYDQPKGPVAAKVCSDNLFGLDKSTGQQQWVYTGGLIINSTITLGGDHAYFVECRNAALQAADVRRCGGEDFWKDQVLVAVDLKSGKKMWEQAIDTHDGESMFSLASAVDTLALVASGDGNFEVSTYSAVDGAPLWDHQFGWPGGKHDHGKAMSRPAIVGNTLYVRPKAFDLTTGKVSDKVVPGGGCGTYACTENTIIFRSGNVTMWNARSGESTSWSRLRPGCWLSTIPASGLLLSPEAGGGCSCGNWLETSIALAPKTH